MQQIIGGTAVWQGIPGALKYGPKMIPARVAPKTTALREGGCFTEGTQIVVCMDQVEDESGNLTTVYTTINIEDVKVGDWVYSYNTLTGETELCEVAETFSLTSSHINLLTFTDEYGHEQTLESTDAHPFWVVTDDPDLSRAARSVVDENSITLYHGNLETGLNGYWVEAKDLRIGDVFLGANGELSALINTVRVDQSDGVAVFNFTVEGNHNYFILTKEYEYGQSCVLVHNNSGQQVYKETRPNLSGRIKKNDIPSWAEGERPYAGENGKTFAKRLLDGKYGEGKYSKGPGSEFNQIKKWGDSGFQDPPPSVKPNM